MRKTRRIIKSSAASKAKAHAKWEIKAKEIKPLFDTRPELKRALLLFREGTGSVHWVDIEGAGQGACKALENHGVIHLLPDRKRYSLTTPGKILLGMLVK